MAEFVTVEQDAPAGTGTQNFTSAGFGTPVAAIFTWSGSTANGTVVNGGTMGMGFTDGSRDRVLSAKMDDGVSPVSFAWFSAHRDNVGVIRMFQAVTNTTIAAATWNAWVTDGVQINWVTASGISGIKIKCTLIGGAGIANAYVNHVTTPSTINTATNVEAPAFQPDVLICMTNGGEPVNVSTDTAAMNIGFVVRGGGQRSIGISTHPTNNPIVNYGRVSSNRAMYFAEDTGTAGAIEITNFDSLGFDAFLRTLDGVALDMSYLALKFSGLTASVVAYDSPIGNVSYSVTGAGFTPQFAMEVFSAMQSTDTAVVDSTDAESFGIGMVAGSSVSSVSRAMDNGGATSNSISVTASNPVHLVKDTGNFQVETFTAWTSDGMTKNATTSNGTARKRIALFIQESQAAVETGADSGAIQASEVVQPITVGVGAVEAG
jgi:hypothetical protein